jgi:hypothetical protein
MFDTDAPPPPPPVDEIVANVDVPPFDPRTLYAVDAAPPPPTVTVYVCPGVAAKLDSAEAPPPEDSLGTLQR